MIKIKSVLQAHDHEVRELIAAVDKQGSGFISYNSFEAVMARSIMQQVAGAQPPDLSSTVRLQPDTSALTFHEVPLLVPTIAIAVVGADRPPIGDTVVIVGCLLAELLRWQAAFWHNSG